MNIDIPVFEGLTLTIGGESAEQSAYPTTRLSKGLLMVNRGLSLAEEAVGFGVPVLNRGLLTIFPGNLELDFVNTDSSRRITAVYRMNLVERITQPGSTSLQGEWLYKTKNSLAAITRRFPLARTSLTTLSSSLRRLFGWETTYESAKSYGEIKIEYTFAPSGKSLQVNADLSTLVTENITEVILMNEQGAHHFDQYRDSSGLCLSGKEIGCWDEVEAEDASFASSACKISFTLFRIANARLFRGRELIGSRLAWAGFGYSSPPNAQNFTYAIKFKRLP